MKSFTAIAFIISLGCKQHITIERKSLQGLFINTLVETDGPRKEFLYFDGKGLVYYMSDTTYPVQKQEQRIIEYATRAKVSFLKDSIIFKLDSFYIGTSTFSATVFNGKRITGEEKIYYHELKTKYSGVNHNDTLYFYEFSVSMQKDTTYSKSTYTRYLNK